MKPKLSFKGLIQKLEDKNISPGSYTEDQIENYLKTRSYYYKISSYRKNFPKLPQGGYDKLTFDHLVATAKLDVRLREYLLMLCLDIEHATRTNLMRILTDDDNEDGYTIVKEFQDKFPEKFKEVLSHFRSSKYRLDMFRKRTQISSWVLMEIIDFGTLVQFLEFYIESRTPKNEKLYAKEHRFIKNIRNSCAHNDVFLINLFLKEDMIPRPYPSTKSFSNSMGINNGLVKYPKIIDLVNLFYIHSKICSDELNNRRYKEGIEVLNKYDENSEMINHSTSLKKFFESIFKKSVDFLNKT